MAWLKIKFMGTYPENGYYFYGRLWLLRLFRILKFLVILNPPPFFAYGAIRITRLVVVFLWCRAKFRHRRRQNIVYLVGGLSFKKFYKSRRGLLWWSWSGTHFSIFFKFQDNPPTKDSKFWRRQYPNLALHHKKCVILMAPLAISERVSKKERWVSADY